MGGGAGRRGGRSDVEYIGVALLVRVRARARVGVRLGVGVRVGGALLRGDELGLGLGLGWVRFKAMVSSCAAMR